jgi:hypothetical protein
MKSNEVYALLREEVAPWAKEQGFRRTRSVLSWTRPHRAENLVFWFQITGDGWDAYAGSRFTVEFALSSEPVVYTGRARQRIGRLLDDEARERLRQIQNSVISSLTLPPKDYYALHVSNMVTDWYLSKFEPIQHPYSTSDIWLRYHDPEHVQAWGRFIVGLLPSCIEQVERW